MEDNTRLVLIEWRDAFGCSPSWTEVADIKPDALTCKSVGWLAHEDADSLVIIPHLSAPDHGHSEQQGCGDMTIPRVSVTRIVRLQEDRATSQPLPEWRGA